MNLNQRITAARNHLARAASYIAESLGTDSLHDTGRFPTEDEDDMCPNCVTPWKCNGPHIPQEYPITTEYELRATKPEGTQRVNAFDQFIRSCVCDSVNGDGHRFVTFEQTDDTEVTACADCGEME